MKEMDNHRGIKTACFPSEPTQQNAGQKQVGGANYGKMRGGKHGRSHDDGRSRRNGGVKPVLNQAAKGNFFHHAGNDADEENHAGEGGENFAIGFSADFNVVKRFDDGNMIEVVDRQQHRQQTQTSQKSRRKDTGNLQLNRQRGKVRRRKNQRRQDQAKLNEYLDVEHVFPTEHGNGKSAADPDHGEKPKKEMDRLRRPLANADFVVFVGTALFGQNQMRWFVRLCASNAKAVNRIQRRCAVIAVRPLVHLAFGKRPVGVHSTKLSGNGGDRSRTKIKSTAAARSECASTSVNASGQKESRRARFRKCDGRLR